MKPDALTVGSVADYLQSFAPTSLAGDWDNVGLLLGDRNAGVQKVMTCLTVTPESAAEAIAAKAQLIVTHHPVLFRPTQRLTRASAEGRMLLDLIAAGISVYSPHSAFDNTAGGINDALARRLGLTDVGPLRKRDGAKQSKIVVFIPDADLERVSDALFHAGAGQIGQYRECSFRLSGMGTFFGGEGTNPTIGMKGQRELVDEWRLEVVCPHERVHQAVEAMRRAHSYEEPAYDVYPLQLAQSPIGEGRIGKLAKPMTLAALAKRVKSSVKARQVQVVGEAGASIQRVALACGAAGEFLRDAVHARADVFLTGEMRFHDFLSARAQEIALLLPGHYATERFGVEELAERLQQQFPPLKVWASAEERDPISVV